jgi:hypothetical protein
MLSQCSPNALPMLNQQYVAGILLEIGLNFYAACLGADVYLSVVHNCQKLVQGRYFYR